MYGQVRAEMVSIRYGARESEVRDLERKYKGVLVIWLGFFLQLCVAYVSHIWGFMMFCEI